MVQLYHTRAVYLHKLMWMLVVFFNRLKNKLILFLSIINMSNFIYCYLMPKNSMVWNVLVLFKQFNFYWLFYLLNVIIKIFSTFVVMFGKKLISILKKQQVCRRLVFAMCFKYREKYKRKGSHDKVFPYLSKGLLNISIWIVMSFWIILSKHLP